jgi:hypothetical protein
MAAVDPDDDDIRRYVVLRYVYDPERRQRRWYVVGAFDRRREGRSLYRSVHREFERRRAAGEVTDPFERYSGEVRHPGDRRRQQSNRLWRDASRRGVRLEELTEKLGPPEGMVFLEPEGRGRVVRFVSRLVRPTRPRFRDRSRDDRAGAHGSGDQWNVVQRG